MLFLSPHCRWVIGLAVSVVSSGLYADDISVPNSFSADTTISSSDMNANFDVLVAESNENDAKIASLNSAIGGESYSLLGYTANNYVYDVATSRVSLITLNNFCKSEFSNEAAQVASLNIFASISARQTITLPTANSLMLASADSAFCDFDGSSSNCIPKGYNSAFNIYFPSGAFCELNSGGLIICNQSDSSVDHPVLCVATDS